MRVSSKEWRNLRQQVLERDGPTCQVCGCAVEDKRNYHCGHIVDRCAGGPDELDNLTVMCDWCNMLKPVHDTTQEYETWVHNGGALADFIVDVMWKAKTVDLSPFVTWAILSIYRDGNAGEAELAAVKQMGLIDEAA